jgi:hypothetical protein
MPNNLFNKHMNSELIRPTAKQHPTTIHILRRRASNPLEAEAASYLTLFYLM